MFWISILYWLAGLTIRLFFNPSSVEANSVIPAYQQIRMRGVIRWLFGYLPVDGPVPVSGFWIQLAALMSLVTVVLVGLFVPLSSHPLVLLAIHGGSIPVSVYLTLHILHKQNPDRGNSKSA
jgi:hypothetical protein